jgi:hypothetical protein
MMNHPLEEYLDEATEIVAHLLERKKDEAPNRCVDNMIAVTVGTLAFKDWATSLGVDLGVPETHFDDGILDMIAQILTGTSPGTVKDTVDDLMEELSIMAHEGIIRFGKHYTVKIGEKGSSLLSIYLPPCLTLYQQWVRSRGGEDRTNGGLSIKRMLKEKQEKGSYVVHVDHSSRFPDDIVHKCLVIDQSKITTSLTYEDFPLHPVKREQKPGNEQ